MRGQRELRMCFEMTSFNILQLLMGLVKFGTQGCCPEGPALRAGESSGSLVGRLFYLISVTESKAEQIMCNKPTICLLKFNKLQFLLLTFHHCE